MLYRYSKQLRHPDGFPLDWDTTEEEHASDQDAIDAVRQSVGTIPTLEPLVRSVSVYRLPHGDDGPAEYVGGKTWEAR